MRIMLMQLKAAMSVHAVQKMIGSETRKHRATALSSGTARWYWGTT